MDNALTTRLAHLVPGIEPKERHGVSFSGQNVERLFGTLEKNNH
jgi:hypothetical protein